MPAPSALAPKSWTQPRMVLRSIPLLLAPCILVVGCEIDRCLDQGGRWNDELSVCEFDSGPAPETEPREAVEPWSATASGSALAAALIVKAPAHMPLAHRNR